MKTNWTKAVGFAWSIDRYKKNRPTGRIFHLYSLLRVSSHSALHITILFRHIKQKLFTFTTRSIERYQGKGRQTLLLTWRDDLFSPFKTFYWLIFCLDTLKNCCSALQDLSNNIKKQTDGSHGPPVQTVYCHLHLFFLDILLRYKEQTLFSFERSIKPFKEKGQTVYTM